MNLSAKRFPDGAFQWKTSNIFLSGQSLCCTHLEGGLKWRGTLPSIFLLHIKQKFPLHAQHFMWLFRPEVKKKLQSNSEFQIQTLFGENDYTTDTTESVG